jgi:hypothetical protein
VRKPKFSTGQEVPTSGIYTTFHAHALASRVALLRSGRFPSCSQCTVPVQFELVSGVPVECAQARFRLLMTGNGMSADDLAEV